MDGDAGSKSNIGKHIEGNMRRECSNQNRDIASMNDETGQQVARVEEDNCDQRKR